MMRILAILLLPLLLSGCYTQTTVKDMIKETEHYQAPYAATTKQGLIYVVRPSSLYGIFKYNLVLTDRVANTVVGYNRGYQYIYFYVNPGIYTITSKAENSSSTKIDIKAGETIYLIQDASFGFLFGRNSLYTINPVEGRYYVKNSTLGTITAAPIQP